MSARIVFNAVGTAMVIGGGGGLLYGAFYGYPPVILFAGVFLIAGIFLFRRTFHGGCPFSKEFPG